MIAFPEISSIAWREISADDAETLAALDGDCKQADGDEPVSNLVGDVLAVAENAPADTLCGVLSGDQIAAVVWIKYSRVEGEQRAVLGGRVHPDYRRRGLGTFLIDWAEDRASQVARPDSLIISNEALTADAHDIYTRHGFTQIFAENMMVCDLGQAVPDAPLLENVSTVQWTPDTRGQFFAAYRGSFADRPGFPDPPAEEWIGEHNESPDFRSDLSMLALVSDEPVGFVTCFVFPRLGWIGQVGVIPEWRKRGIADRVLVGALNRFKAEGFNVAALHVNINNPRATRVYERLGFIRRLQRARYLKTLTV